MNTDDAVILTYPTAVDPSKVGSYPALAKAGGGYVWDEVLEYRVWCHPERGADDVHDGDDYFYAFATFAEASDFSRQTTGAEEPLALVLQKEYIEEPSPGQYLHVKESRITEWPVEFLTRPKRNDRTIPNFVSPNAPANRLDIIRGKAGQPGAAATVHVFASTGRFSSSEQMREFIDPTFTEDGDLVPSRFIDEVQLGGYEPGCIEAIHAPEPKALRDLLHGVSYGEQWLHLVDPSVVASEAICVFEPNTLGRPTASSMQYCGAYQYPASS